ncbi:MAG: tetratricopeptide repeat protein [Rhodospirillaceae bacterium]|nr:tetratricopeptide repeat protein [Rhodospirillales bacterium]
MDVEQELQLGLVAHRAGDLGQAVRHYRAVLSHDGDNADALNLMSVIAMQAGDMSTAVTLAARATMLRPDWFGGWISLGNALQAQGRQAEAVDAFQKAVTLSPSSCEAYGNLASALNQLGRFEQAADAAVQAIVINGGMAEAHINFGNALLGMNSPGEALEAFQKALGLQPENVAAWCNVGIAQAALGEYAGAVAACDRAIVLGDLAEAHYCRGGALLAQGRLEDARVAFAAVVQRAPDHLDAYNNLAVTLERMGRLDEAVAVLRDAIASAPEDFDLHLNLAFVLLRSGQYEEGWREYEWRWGAAHFRRFHRSFPMPLWHGEDLAGKSILIHAEQGYGDALQFCRYAPLLAARGATVTLECRKDLSRLFATMAGIAVLDHGAPLDGFDYVIPLMSLPFCFGTTLETVPASIPYLSVPADARGFPDIAAAQGLKVGFVWSGSGTRGDNSSRSCAAGDFAPLLAVPGCRFFSLQKGKADSSTLDSRLFTDIAPQLGDFADTAAAIAALDLVITVDTAVAHLAGALGKPVWVLLSRPSNAFLWMEGGTDSPWYPTVRLFRQPVAGDWAGLFAAVRQELLVLAHAA